MNGHEATDQFYALLELPLDADQDMVKRAYRRLAQLHHPDANPNDPDAAGRFRKIAEAYAVVSSIAHARGETPTEARPFKSRTPEAEQYPTVDELMAASGAILGRHIVTPITMPLEHVVTGASVSVEAEGIEPTTVEIPPGVEDGDIVRIEGKGSVADGTQGDIIVIVNVPRHARFERDGDDLTVAREVNVSDLALGTTVTVSTLHGPASVTIPAGTPPGTVIELEGYGVRRSEGDSGSLFVRIESSSGGAAKNLVDKGSFSSLVDVLDDEAMEVIPTVGRLFDSELHEVVGKVDPGPGTLVVTGEVRRGYRVQGRVIRPALVTVSRKAELP